MEAIRLPGTVMGLGFVSGVNLYATVLAVGLAVNLETLRDLLDRARVDRRSLPSEAARSS
jgi:hypothetical protein